MPTEKIIINQAEIDAANRAIAAAQQRLTAAEGAKTAFGVQNQQTITRNIQATAAATKAFNEALKISLKSGGSVKDAYKTASDILKASRTELTPLSQELTGLESDIRSASSALAGLSVPAPVYKEIETGPTLAIDIFKKTLALFFGDDEVKNPWVDELYKVVSGYYKQGATIDESLNFSLRDARNNPNLTKFTNRFRAIFALEDKLRAGQAVYVPSISEYVATEIKVGDVFRTANLGDLATQDFIADVLSKNKSVSEITKLVTNAFDVIDTAPAIWKNELASKFPTATRSGLAKAILLGEQSARELEQTTQVIGVQAAAKAQGLAVSAERAQDIFAQGYGFAKALPAFGEVAAILPRAQQLAEFSRQAPVTQLDVEQARIEGLASQQRKLIQLAEEERARLSGSSGTTRFSSSQALKGTF